MRTGQHTYNAFCRGMAVTFLLLLACVGEGAGQSRSFLFEIRSPAYKGSLLFDEGDYAASIPLLEQALSAGKYKDNPQLREKLAHAYSITGKPASGAQIYRDLLEGGTELDRKQALQYANGLMAGGQLEEGRRVLVHYLTVTGQEGMAKEVREMPVADLFRDSIRYSVAPASVNTIAAEFSPVLTSSGVIFVSDRAKAGIVKSHFSADESFGLDLFYGKLSKEGDILQVTRLSGSVNSEMPEGPAVVANREKSLYFTRSGAGGDMRLYQASAILSLSSWGSIKPLEIPFSGSAAHPAVSPDGKVIYFVSDMAGGYGGSDIYKTEKTETGWLAPVNLGPRINTAGNEMFPVLAGENRLLFSSNGHMGLGGLDIYEVTLSADTIVAVRNFGAPVNSSADDFGLSVHECGEWGFFSSNRAGGAGKDDIYKLKIHQVTLAGKLTDNTNNQGISDALVQLFQDNVLLQEVSTDMQGNYQFKLYPGQEYELNFLAADYRRGQERVSTRQGQRTGVKELERGLERKVKMFVLGTIHNSNRTKAPGATVYAIDQATGKKDSVQADHKGNYEIELDVMSRYTFLTICDQEASISEFSTPEKGKASVSYYENMKLSPFNVYQVQGSVKIPSGKKGPVVISRFNEVSRKSDLLITDETGSFSFEASAQESYELCVLNGEGGSPVYLSSGWNKPVRKTELSW